MASRCVHALTSHCSCVSHPPSFRPLCRLPVLSLSCPTPPSASCLASWLVLELLLIDCGTTVACSVSGHPLLQLAQVEHLSPSTRQLHCMRSHQFRYS